jgi:hypothetical protein
MPRARLAKSSQSDLHEALSTMFDEAGIIELQAKQDVHDSIYHRDVYLLVRPRRICHLVLHFSKYCGRLATNVRNNQTPSGRTLADIFIICLSAANVIGFPLSEVATDATSNLGQGTAGRNLCGLLLEATVDTARAAKACEALDHMEFFDYATVLKAAVSGLARTTIQLAHLYALDLRASIQHRWDEIERSANA